MIFEIHGPADFVFGRKSRLQLVKKLIPGNVFILCGSHAVKRIEKELLPELAGRKIEIFSGFPPEAPLAETDKALAAARSIGARNIIGWGGGSCIDGAKAIAALLDTSLTVTDVFRNDLSFDCRNCFFAALPTTAGTAAEMTPNAVLCDAETNIKKSLRGSGMFADAAFIDPELLEDAPDHVLFSSGFDALTQGIESTISAKADAASSMLATEGTFLTWQGLQLLASGCRDGKVFDMLGRGCMLSGAAFVRSGLGAAHGIGHPISGLKGVPHGVCCAVLLVEVLKWNLPFSTDAMERLAMRLGMVSPEKVIEEVAVLRSRCGLPSDFSSWGLQRKDFPFVIKNCRSGSMKCNPRYFSDEEVAALLEKLI